MGKASNPRGDLEWHVRRGAKFARALAVFERPAVPAFEIVAPFDGPDAEDCRLAIHKEAVAHRAQ